MTTEEAISIIERVEHTESKWPGTEDTLEALDMAIAALRAQQQTEANKPLTLDELRKMDGEPVWVVPIGETDWSAHWDIFGQGYVTASSDTKRAKMYFLYAEHLGKTWLAYRRKTEEAHHGSN